MQAFDAEAFQRADRLAQLVGHRPESVAAGNVVYVFDVGPRHHNPNGVMHGGALFAAMDSSQGAAIYSLPDFSGKRATVAEANIRFKKAFVDGRITIRTSIAKRAKKLLYVVSEALDQDGGTIAVLEGTWMIV
jgi:uncharacterized protein (TIGR00369 family)